MLFPDRPEHSANAKYQQLVIASDIIIVEENLIIFSGSPTVHQKLRHNRQIAFVLICERANLFDTRCHPTPARMVYHPVGIRSAQPCDGDYSSPRIWPVAGVGEGCGWERCPREERSLRQTLPHRMQLGNVNGTSDCFKMEMRVITSRINGKINK